VAKGNNLLLLRGNNFLSKSAYPIGFFFLTFIGLLYYYRQGGIVDSIYGDSAISGMRDVGVYIDAADKISRGESPYSQLNLGFRAGAFGTLIFLPFGTGSISFLLSQILNLFGIFVFAYALLRNHSAPFFFFIASTFAIWFSCTREILATGQITGVIFGLIGIGYLLTQSEKLIFNAVGGFFFAIAADLKPNLVAMLILGIYIYLQKVRLLVFPFLSVILGHLSVNLATSKFLEREWLDILKTVSNPEINPHSSGTRTIWPLIIEQLDIGSIPSLIPVMTFLILSSSLLILLGTKRDFIYLIALILVPVSYSYFHLYSFSPIALMFIWKTFTSKLWLEFGVGASFLLVSGVNLGLREFLISFVVLTVFLLECKRRTLIENHAALIVMSAFGGVSLLRGVWLSEISTGFFGEVVNLNLLLALIVFSFFRGNSKLTRT
jgi:hypothetical protein